MVIIALYGKQNVGKSTSIRGFYDKHVVGNPLFSVEEGGAIAPNDVKAKAKYKGKYIVGIVSQGDTAWHVNDGAKNVGECDVLICATRSKCGSVEAARGLSAEIIWVPKGSFSQDGDALSGETLAQFHTQLAEEAADRLYQLLQAVCP